MMCMYSIDLSAVVSGAPSKTHGVAPIDPNVRFPRRGRYGRYDRRNVTLTALRPRLRVKTKAVSGPDQAPHVNSNTVQSTVITPHARYTRNIYHNTRREERIQ